MNALHVTKWSLQNGGCEAALKAQVQKLQAQLSGHPLTQRIQQLEAGEAAAQAKVDAAHKAEDELRLQVAAAQRQLQELQSQLAAARDECDAYLQEIEVTGKAYENMTLQNTSLLEQLSKRDEEANALVTERIKLNQQLTTLVAQLSDAHEEVGRAKQEAVLLQNVRDAAVKEAGSMSEELAGVREQVVGLTATLESVKAELGQKSNAVAQLQLQLDSANKRAGEHQAAADAEADKANKERSKRQRLEEEHKVLAARVDKLRKSVASGVAKELQDEVDEMRNQLVCSVCHTERKNVIITRCFHMFCHGCIQKNLDNRQRKCPGCGHPFGQADVKTFYFT